MKVLSLFDGISCGQFALARAKIDVEKYFASEIEKRAIDVASSNFPEMVHIGDVSKVKAQDFGNIDLIIGGSPCQGFSFAGKQLNFDDPRSALFFEFVRILNEVKKQNPNVKFMLENVKMKKDYRDIITKYLGVEPVLINSNCFSAQNRPRYYWFNWDVPNDFLIDKSKTLLEVAQFDIAKGSHYELGPEKIKIAKLSCENLPQAMTERRTEEAKRIRREYMRLHGKDFSPRRAKEWLTRTDGKMNCLTATYSEKEHSIFDANMILRKSTPLEWERLQGLPDFYTRGHSDSQRYKMLGNGWQVDTVKHIFDYLKKDLHKV